MNILILNQAFYPDVVSTAQHASDLAVHLTERGHRVTAVASSRGYDDSKMKLPKRETWKGVRIWRVSALRLGKKARWQRFLNFASFVLSCSARLLMLRRFDMVVAMTSPPLISFIAALLVALKGGQLVYWVMDLNPDEALAAGWLRPGSATARWLAVLSRFSLRKAHTVVALDRFMRDRLLEKSIPAESIAVLPPWSHDDVVRYDPPGRAAFREQHGLTGSFVVMYSGNHSPCHPLNTVLEAALRLANYSRVAFCFVGGGSEFEKVGRFKAAHALE